MSFIPLFITHSRSISVHKNADWPSSNLMKHRKIVTCKSNRSHPMTGCTTAFVWNFCMFAPTCTKWMIVLCETDWLDFFDSFGIKHSLLLVINNSFCTKYLEGFCKNCGWSYYSSGFYSHWNLNMHLFYLWGILLLSQPTHSVYIPACINDIIFFKGYFDVVHEIDELW